MRRLMWFALPFGAGCGQYLLPEGARLWTAAGVLLLGLAMTFPSKVWITALRKGFCSKETFTINTVRGSPKKAQASARAVPHCPAPVSVVSPVSPSFLAY